MKKIFFTPKDKLTESIITPPQPASKNIAEWYRKLPVYINKNNNFYKGFNLRTNLTAKSCMPFFDAMNCGYLITFPCDVHFVDPTSNVSGFNVIWDVSWDVITRHSEAQVEGIPIPENFDKSAWKLTGNWRIKTPKGYSLLYTHPFYRYDLPFITATAIVDSDVYDADMNISFFLPKNFLGTIKRGTPVAQIIPIKRDSWKSQTMPYDEKNDFSIDNIRLVSRGSYKKRFWQKKYYK
jgi:hypothetical protein